MRKTYESLGMEIAEGINEDIRFNNCLFDGDKFSDVIIDQMVMDKASEVTPDYLDHYDVADKAREMIEYDNIVHQSVTP